jgi:hypothetical protein
LASFFWRSCARPLIGRAERENQKNRKPRKVGLRHSLWASPGEAVSLPALSPAGARLVRAPFCRPTLPAATKTLTWSRTTADGRCKGVSGDLRGGRECAWAIPFPFSAGGVERLCRPARRKGSAFPGRPRSVIFGRGCASPPIRAPGSDCHHASPITTRDADRKGSGPHYLLLAQPRRVAHTFRRFLSGCMRPAVCRVLTVSCP